MAKKEIRQRMIFMCDLPTGDVSEFSGLHPCLIASVDLRNTYSPNVYVFPITHQDKKWQPTHYKLTKESYPFFVYDENIVICEEGRSISRTRIQNDIGVINTEDFDDILKCKDYVFLERDNKRISFSKINVGQSFVINVIEIGTEIEQTRVVCVKTAISGSDKFGALNLDTCEFMKIGNSDLVYPCYDIGGSFKYKANKIRDLLNKTT